MPTLTNSTKDVTAINITANSATLYGDWSHDNTVERGVVLALTSVHNEPKVDGGSGVTVERTTNTTGCFTVEVTGLEPGTSYSLRAYARINKNPEPLYSDLSTFCTLPASSVTDLSWTSTMQAWISYVLIFAVLATIAIVAVCNYEKLSTSTLPVLVTFAVLATIAITVAYMAKTWSTPSSPDFARGLITVLFSTGTMAIAFILVVAVVFRTSTTDNVIDKGKDILAILIGIFGTIMGFYFGTAKPTQKPDNTDNNDEEPDPANPE